MVLRLFYSLHVLYLVMMIPQSTEQETGVTSQWKLGFSSLTLDQSLSSFFCFPDRKSLDAIEVSLVAVLLLPSGRKDKGKININNPYVDCGEAAVSLVSRDSEDTITITVGHGESCRRQGRLKLYLQVDSRYFSTPKSFSYKAIDPEQTAGHWTDISVLDSARQSTLALKWRVDCDEFSIVSALNKNNAARLKRQAEGRLPSAQLSNSTVGPNTSLPMGNVTDSDDVLNETANTTDVFPTNTSATQKEENTTMTGDDVDSFASGEPPDSFVTGITEIFGLTKNPFENKSSKSPYPSTASKQFTTMLKNLFGSSSDVLSRVNVAASIKSTSPDIIKNTRPGAAVPNSSTTVPTEKYEQGSNETKTSTDISAAAAENSVVPSSGLVNMTVDDIPDIPQQNVTASSNNGTDTGNDPNSAMSTTGVFDFSESDGTDHSNVSANPDSRRAENTTAAGIANSSTNITVSVLPSAGLTTAAETGTKTQSTVPGNAWTSTTIPITTKTSISLTTLTTRSSTTTPGTRPSTKTSTTTASTTKIQTTTTLATTTPTTTIQTTTPTTASTTTTSTTTTTVSKTTSSPRKSTKRSDAASKTNKDVVFTTAKPSPALTFPETSNELYRGKTGETSSAGWFDKDPAEISDSSDETNEATLWPIVMGLVIGIPTIIVISIAITVVQKKHIGLPHRHLSSPGYFERRPPQVPFVEKKKSQTICELEKPPTDIEV